MKKVLAFDLDDTLNVAKTPIEPEMAKVLVACLSQFIVAPISGQKFDQFLRQIVAPLVAAGVSEEQLMRLHLFVAQGTQYYRFGGWDRYEERRVMTGAERVEGWMATEGAWEEVYNYPLSDEQITEISAAIKQAAMELGFWEEDKLAAGDEIIENRRSQVTFSALGQTAGTEAKYAWDPDLAKRTAIVARAKELAPDFMYEIGGTTSINVTLPGRNKAFGMNKMMEVLGVAKEEILYFGDMTQPGGNDYPVVEMGIETVTVKNWQETAERLKGILAEG